MSPTVSIRQRAAFRLPALAAMVGGLVLAAPLAATAAPSAATFAIAVSDAEVQVGDTVDVTVTATAAVDVYAYELLLGFDPAVLEYVDGSAQTAISGTSGASVVGSDVSFVHTKLGTSPSASGDLTLATLSFEAIGAGDVSLALDAELVGADAVSVAVTDAATADVSVAAPAEPATPPVVTDPATPVVTDPATPGSPAGAGATPVSGRDSLSDTGTEVTPWPLAAGAAALLLGAVLVLAVRRKRATQGE